MWTTTQAQADICLPFSSARRIDLGSFPTSRSVSLMAVRYAPELISAFVSPQSIELPVSLEKATPLRRTEYLIGRACAAALLKDMGSRTVAVGYGNHRQPVWPDGFVGSISHTGSHAEHLAVATVASCRTLCAVGIDLEKRLDAEAFHAVCSTCLLPEEERWLECAGELDPFMIVALLFSAKEAFFKCLYPLVGKFFDFVDAAVTHVDFSVRQITITLQHGLTENYRAGFSLTGEFCFLQEHVFSFFEIPARMSDPVPAFADFEESDVEQC